jgi:hypothetical protein
MKKKETSIIFVSAFLVTTFSLFLYQPKVCCMFFAERAYGLPFSFVFQRLTTDFYSEAKMVYNKKQLFLSPPFETSFSAARGFFSLIFWILVLGGIRKLTVKLK